MLVFVFVCRLHNSGALSFSYLGHWQKRSLLWQLRPCLHLLSINTGPLNATSFYFCISMYFCICIANKAHAAPVLRQHNICTHPDIVALKVKPNISGTYSLFFFWRIHCWHICKHVDGKKLFHCFLLQGAKSQKKLHLLLASVILPI